MSLTGPSWSFHWYRQGAMTVLGGDVRNMEHHGQFERQQEKPDEVSIMRSDMNHHGQEKKPPQVVLMQLHTGEWGGLLVKVIYFLAAIIGALLPLERLLYVVETDSSSEETCGQGNQVNSNLANR